MDFLQSLFSLIMILPAVLSALPPTVQSINDFPNNAGLNLLASSGSSLNSSISGGTNISFPAEPLLYDADVQCYVQPPITYRQYRPIVSHDFQPTRSNTVSPFEPSTTSQTPFTNPKSTGPGRLLPILRRHLPFTKFRKASNIHTRSKHVPTPKRQLCLSGGSRSGCCSAAVPRDPVWNFLRSNPKSMCQG